MRFQRFRALAALGLGLLLAALPGQAQEGSAPPEPVRFLLETITVSGAGEAAANIVRAETLLDEGRSYTEADLVQAIARVHRLPFVLEATFALKKGSQRGAYELAIDVQPARWFFFDQWSHGFQFDEPVDLPEGRADALVGGRLFLGRSGVLFAALDTVEGAQAGFTQYDLFHRGILLSAVVSRTGGEQATEVLPLTLDPTFASWSFEDSTRVSLGLSVPAGPRQSVQASLSQRTGDARERRPVLVSEARFPVFFTGESSLTYRRAEVKWVYDTSDDPLLPTRGTSLSAGLEAARFESESLRPVTSSAFDPPLPPFEAEQVVLAVSVIRHFSITPRQTVTVSARGSAGQSRLENLFTGTSGGEEIELGNASLDSLGGAVGVRHSVALRRHRERGNLSDLRFETGAEIGGERTAPDLGPSPLKRLSVSVGIVFRNQWGRVRATFTYLDLGEVAR
ncbi:MAG TPA: hypothetical protein VJ725_12670 [Thermoanaerobaculia bacterium]|nr:hypothetical protein [Thermoanaerobaculia bacterium]